MELKNQQAIRNTCCLLNDRSTRTDEESTEWKWDCRGRRTLQPERERKRGNWMTDPLFKRFLFVSQLPPLKSFGSLSSLSPSVFLWVLEVKAACHETHASSTFVEATATSGVFHEICIMKKTNNWGNQRGGCESRKLLRLYAPVNSV